MTMGQKMKQLRKEKGLTMEDLATEFNKKYSSKLNKTVISRLENNKLSNNNKYLGYYIDYFGVSYEWLQNDEQTRHIVKNATIQSLMTYKKFKQEVEKLGLRCIFYDYGVSVCLMDCDYHLATIYNTIKYFGIISFNSIFSSFDTSKLFNLCCELIQTPLDERGKIK